MVSLQEDNKYVLKLNMKHKYRFKDLALYPNAWECQSAATTIHLDRVALLLYNKLAFTQ